MCFDLIAQNLSILNGPVYFLGEAGCGFQEWGKGCQSQDIDEFTSNAYDPPFKYITNISYVQNQQQKNQSNA